MTNIPTKLEWSNSCIINKIIISSMSPFLEQFFDYNDSLLWLQYICWSLKQNAWRSFFFNLFISNSVQILVYIDIVKLGCNLNKYSEKMNKSTIGFLHLVFLIRKVNIEHICNTPIISINKRFHFWHFRVKIHTSE